MINVFNYTDYKTFLNDYIDHKQKTNQSFSIGCWSKKLGLANTASLSRVLAGNRLPGNKITQQLLDYFKFKNIEAEYFEKLILLKKVENDSALSLLVLEKLKSIHPTNSFKILDSDSYKVLSKWYFVAIREMVNLSDFNEDPKWIKERLKYPVTVSQINDAIKTLVSCNLLKRLDDGKLVQSDEHIVSEHDVSDLAIKKFHVSHLDHAKESLYKDNVREREFNTICLTINSKNIEKIKKHIRNFKNKFIDLMEDENGDQTSILQVQFFPLTKTGASNEDS